MSDSAYYKKRTAQLNKNIQENLEILEEYEHQRRQTKDPREKRTIADQITDTKQLIEQDREEKEKLEADAGPAPSRPAKLPNTVKAAPEADSEKQENKQPDRREATTAILDSPQHDDATLAMGFLSQRDIGQAEMQETLNAIIMLLDAVDKKQSALSAEVREKLSQAQNAAKSGMSLRRKLEYTLPIVPLFLNYKVEFGVENSVDLNAVWLDLQKRWKSLVSRADKNIWPLSTIKAYGELPREQENYSSEDPLSIAHQKFYLYQQQFSGKYQYLLTFDAKLDQSVANINILIKARKECEDLAELVRTTAGEFSSLQATISKGSLYPSADLKRIAELAELVANASHTAAGLLAGHQNANSQIAQIKRNMPMLIRMMEQFVTWLGQMNIITAM